MNHTQKPAHPATAASKSEAIDGEIPVQTAQNEGGAEKASEESDAPSPEFAALQAENASLKERLARSLAEMENLRRRTEKEVADARIYGVSNFARDMLPLADNLERAIENAPKDIDGAMKSFIEGLNVIDRDFHSRLTRHGVKKMEPQGRKFDPNFHEALFEAPDPNTQSGMVSQVVESGYMIGERILRPAKVGVSRGGAKS